MNRIQTVAATASLAVLALTARVCAASVAFTQTPLTNAIAQLDRQYGIHIVLKGGLAQTSGRLVSFSVDDPATRLQVVNALANAIGVEFQKGFVINKVAPGEITPPVNIDSNGYVVFKSTTVSAADAISAVAATDSATVQVSPDVTGTVVLSATTLRTPDAAREIARQTHTRWSTYYALAPTGTDLGSIVVGHTSSGQPITQDAFRYYGSPNQPHASAVPGPANLGVAGGTSQQDASNAQTSADGSYTPYNYGALYGYDPYASPYFSYNTGPAFGPDGNQYQTTTGGVGYGGFSGGGITVLPGSGGYGPFGGNGGSPVTFGGY